MKNINKKIILASTLIALFASCGSSGGSSNIKPNIPKAMKAPKKDIENINAMINPKPTVSASDEGYKVQEDDMEMDDEVAYTVVDPIKYHKDWSEFTGDLTNKKDKQIVFKLANSKQFFYHGKLDIKGTKSIGILAEDSKIAYVINDGTINVEGDNSKGIKGNSKSDITSSNDIYVNGENSVGIYSDGGQVRTDKGNIFVKGEGAVGLELVNLDEGRSELQQTISLAGNKTTGIKTNNANVKTAMGENVNITSKATNSIAMYGTNGSTVTNLTDDGGHGRGTYKSPNNANINIDGSTNTGIKVDKKSHGFNEGIIRLNGSNNTGMLAIGKDVFARNDGTIEINGTNSIAMEARGGATVENDGDIILPGKGNNINDWNPSQTVKIMNPIETNGDSATNMKQFNDNHGNSAFKIDANSKFINKGSITFKGNK